MHDLLSYAVVAVFVICFYAFASNLVSMDRFVVFTYRSFKQASAAYHLMLAGFVAFFVTETVELFGELEIIEESLNMISITLILGGHIVLLSWLLKRRT